jgi:hypothetical protein
MCTVKALLTKSSDHRNDNHEVVKTVFARLVTRIVGSNPTQGMDV